MTETTTDPAREAALFLQLVLGLQQAAMVALGKLMNPVTNSRSRVDGIISGMGDPCPHISATAPMPIVIMMAVPRNSQKYSGKWRRASTSGSRVPTGSVFDSITRAEHA